MLTNSRLQTVSNCLQTVMLTKSRSDAYKKSSCLQTVALMLTKCHYCLQKVATNNFEQSLMLTDGRAYKLTCLQTVAYKQFRIAYKQSCLQKVALMLTKSRHAYKQSL
jgi:hypothetical protein